MPESEGAAQIPGGRLVAGVLRAPSEACSAAPGAVARTADGPEAAREPPLTDDSSATGTAVQTDEQQVAYGLQVPDDSMLCA